VPKGQKAPRSKHIFFKIIDHCTPFYSFGGKWFNGPNYAPIAKKGQLKGGRYGRYSDDQIISYLDTCKKYHLRSAMLIPQIGEDGLP